MNWQKPDAQAAGGRHLKHDWPPAPHALLADPGLQTPLRQHPAQLPGPHEPASAGWQLPCEHEKPPGQKVQLLPNLPQLDPEVPGWHRPPEQQPEQLPGPQNPASKPP